MDDIVPSLLETIQTQFDKQTYNSAKLKKTLRALKNKKATYLEVNDFAIEVGEILADVLGTNITAEILPDGKMYFNIADRILNPTMQKNFDLVSNFASDVQTELNHAAGIKLKAQSPALNQDRIDGLINRLSSESDFEAVKWILQEPIVNFTQSVVDDAIRENVDFHARSGLQPTITRTVRGKACDWCKNLAGTYIYHEEPDNIYQRHDRCRCTVEYNPKDARGLQNSHTKKWRDTKKDAKIEERKVIGLRQPDIQLPKSVSAKARDIFVKRDITLSNRKEKIKAGSKITNVKVIAGKGGNRKIDIVNFLVEKYPETTAKDWQKKIGFVELDSGERIEAHWFEAPNVGKIMFKEKRWN